MSETNSRQANSVKPKNTSVIFSSSQWMIAGAGDPPSTSVNLFLHGDSPSSGEYWESQSLISFEKLKLTNNRSSIMQGQVCLHSMHKYLPRIHIKELDPTDDLVTPGNLKKAINNDFWIGDTHGEIILRF